MNDYRIRPAARQDVTAILAMQRELQAHLFASNPGLWRPSQTYRREAGKLLAKDMADSGVCWLVACAGEQELIGIISGHVMHQTRYTPTVYGQIGRLYVQSHWRQRGVGRALVAAICGFFAAHDIDDITLRYVIGNAEAERFWTRLGLQPRIITAGTSRADLEAHFDENDT